MQPPLHRLRSFLGISQRELAHMLNVSHGLLSKIETGQRNTPPALAIGLAQWMLAIDLVEASTTSALLSPAVTGLRWLQSTLARHEREARRLQNAIEVQRPKVEAYVQQQQRWAAMEALLPQFPAMDADGFALLRDRRQVRYTGWLPAELAAQEAALEQLQRLIARLRVLETSFGQ